MRWYEWDGGIGFKTKYSVNVIELCASVLKKDESEKIRNPGFSKKIEAKDQTGSESGLTSLWRPFLVYLCDVGVPAILIGFI